MANLFDVYNDGSLIDHTEGEKLETGETPITITGLTPDTTYDKVQVAFHGSYSRSDIPSFKTEFGRNLLLGTSNWSGDSTRWTKRGTVTDSSGTYMGLTIASTSKAWTSPIYMIQNAGILQIGKIYTFSTYIRNTSDTDTKVASYYDSTIITANSGPIPLSAHTDWIRVSVTFKVIKDPTTSTAGLRWEGQQELTGGNFEFAGYKLEEGSIATPWVPAPDDSTT